jgi:hypothetical protein
MRSGSVPCCLPRDVESNVSLVMETWLPVDSGYRPLRNLWCNVGFREHIVHSHLLEFVEYFGSNVVDEPFVGCMGC